STRRRRRRPGPSTEATADVCLMSDALNRTLVDAARQIHASSAAPRNCGLCSFSSDVDVRRMRYVNAPVCLKEDCPEDIRQGAHWLSLTASNLAFRSHASAGRFRLRHPHGGALP